MFGACYVGKVIKTNVKGDDVMQNAIQVLNQEKNLLQGHGLSDKIISLILIQDYMESGGYTNKGYKLHNNPGNIMWNKHLKYGTKGTFNKANGTYYANFKDLDEYIKEKLLVLSQKPGLPLQAKGIEHTPYTDAVDFVHRLKQNKYFGDQDEKSYYKAMEGTAKRINLLSSLQDDTGQNVVVPENQNAFISWWQDLPTWKKWGIVGGSLTGLVLLTHRN